MPEAHYVDHLNAWKIRRWAASNALSQYGAEAQAWREQHGHLDDWLAHRLERARDRYQRAQRRVAELSEQIRRAA